MRLKLKKFCDIFGLFYQLLYHFDEQKLKILKFL